MIASASKVCLKISCISSLLLIFFDLFYRCFRSKPGLFEHGLTIFCQVPFGRIVEVRYIVSTQKVIKRFIGWIKFVGFTPQSDGFAQHAEPLCTVLLSTINIKTFHHDKRTLDQPARKRCKKNPVNFLLLSGLLLIHIIPKRINQRAFL